MRGAFFTSKYEISAVIMAIPDPEVNSKFQREAGLDLGGRTDSVKQSPEQLHSTQDRTRAGDLYRQRHRDTVTKIMLSDKISLSGPSRNKPDKTRGPADCNSPKLREVAFNRFKLD